MESKKHSKLVDVTKKRERESREYKLVVTSRERERRRENTGVGE